MVFQALNITSGLSRDLDVYKCFEYVKDLGRKHTRNFAPESVDTFPRNTSKTEKFLYTDIFPGLVRTRVPCYLNKNVKRTYRLVKLRTSTVEDLMQLKTQMSKGSMDNLITMMIGIMEAKRLTLRNSGWEGHSKR